MKPAWIIGFSGHRRLDHPDLVRDALHTAMRDTMGKVVQAGGRLHVLVSAAYGADLLCMEVAQALKIPVHIVLPKPVITDDAGEVCFTEGFAADFLDAQGQPLHEEWRRAHTLIRKAQRNEDGWTCRIVNGTQVDPECYYDTGVQIMEAADLFLTVWDGKPARGLGGTAELVEQANKLGLPMQRIHPENGEIDVIRYEKFSPANDEGQKLMAALHLESGLNFEQQFQALDEKANLHSSRFRNLQVRRIWLNALATITAAIAALLSGTSLAAAQMVASLALIEWILVVIAWMKLRQMTRGNTHAEWVRSRFAVELMRAMSGSISLLDPLHPPIFRHKKEWVRFAVSAGLQLAAERGGHRPWREERDAYVSVRLDDARSGQIPHFLRKQAEAAPVFERLSRVNKIASSAAVFFVFGAFLYKGSVAFHGTFYGGEIKIPEGWTKLVVAFFFRFLPIALPLIAGVSAALRSAKDCGRRTFRYQELALRLSVAREQMIELKTESSCRRCVLQIEEILLDELIEWHLSEKQNGSSKK
jgi:hypothetical protein